MPPEGYDTITVPEELASELAEYAEEIGVEKKPDAIRVLLNNTPRQDEIPEIKQSINRIQAAIDMMIDPGAIATQDDIEELNQKLTVIQDSIPTEEQPSS
jgi:metal-responsive CopG/Arc/MetJ family transcriptional regulator